MTCFRGAYFLVNGDIQENSQQVYQFSSAAQSCLTLQPHGLQQVYS